jgi:hypothetical protein
MSDNGSIAASLPASVERPLDAYYYADKKNYMIPRDGGGWVVVNLVGLKIALKRCGLLNMAGRGELLTPIEHFIDELHTQYAVDYAGPLAGYRYGLYQENGYNVLVTDELKLPDAVQGECPVIEALFGRWFGDEQLPYVLGWLKHAYLNLLPDNKAFQPAQLLAVCGLPGAGKNLFQDIVTAVLGGRVAKPYRYLSSGTEFNADLTGAEHLQISDEVATQEYKTRRKFGSALKDICVNSVQSIHSKGKNAINLPVRWRMTASLNDRDEDLGILPTYEPQLWEKIILIKVEHGRDLLPDSAGREAFWTQIKGELPALCHHLITHQIPEAIRHPRYGVRHFHNKDLLTALDQLSPEVQLHDLIYEHVLDGGSISEWKGSASDLMNVLFDDHQTEYQAKRVCTSTRQTGIYLNRLEEKKGSNYILVDVTNKRNTHRRWYEIKPKAQP